jgi:SAM-dependent methyltransferase
MDAIAQFKDGQKKAWAGFAVMEVFTALAAPRLVRCARVTAGQRVLDVGCGTGVVALTAAREGAKVTGLDLTPELVEHAKKNAHIAGADIDFHLGDAEAIHFDDGTFDVVLSQFGHMFAPRPEVTVSEMLRVLRPGGVLAFSTWPPELYTGTMFALIGKYGPPPPAGAAPPPLWGDPNVVRERLGSAVREITFDRDLMFIPMLSPRHGRLFMEQNIGPVTRVVAHLASDPDRLAAFRHELEDLIGLYFEDNTMRQDFLVTRAVKK